MTRKQICALASVSALFFLTGLAAWKLSNTAPEMSDSATAIFTTSIVLFLLYLFSTRPNRTKK